MGKTVDSKVVELKFDNKQFENGVKQSLSTLNKLKQTLSKLTTSNKAFEGLNKASKTSKSSIDSIADSVAALEKRFSFFGETARKVMNTVRDTLVNGVGKGINFVTDSVVSGGIKRAMNIENAHFQLQALLKDETKVQEVMDNAMESVDGTAFAYDEAAKAASMFAASGIQAGDDMVNALKGISGTAAMTNADFERIALIFTSVAGQGRLMGDQLLQLSSLGLNAPATIAAFFNGINDGSKKASAEVTKAVKQISNGTKVTEGDIREFVSDGEVSFKIFAEAMYEAFGESAARANETFTGSLSNIKSALARIGAGFISPLVEQNSKVIKLFNAVREKINEVKKALVFDKELGNVNALSKRFTDSVLSMAKSATNFVKNLDVESGMKVFYNVVDSVINIVKALGSVLAPVGKAFADVFLNFKVGDVIKATSSLKDFTSGLILSEGASKALQSVFKGLFSVVKLIIDGFVGLLKAVLPVGTPMKSLGDIVLTLAGYLGEALSKFTEWIRTSPAVQRAYTSIANGIKGAMKVVSSFISVIGSFIKKMGEMHIAEKIINTIINAFRGLGEVAAPYVEAIGNKLAEFGNKIKDMLPNSVEEAFNKFVDVIKRLKNSAKNLSLDDVLNGVKKFTDRLKEMLSSLKGSTGLQTFIDNIKTFGEKVKKAFDFSEAVKNIESFKSLVQSFVSWVKETLGPIFSNASFGGSIATAGGIGIIYAVVKLTEILNGAKSTLSSVEGVLKNFAGTLKSYQKNIQADTLKKTASAILALAAALAVLSFTDTKKALEASQALSIISGVLLVGTTELVKALSQGNIISDASNKFAKGAAAAMKNISKAIKWKAIGSAFKDFGVSIMMIAGSLIAIGIMYNADKDALYAAATCVTAMAVVMTAIMTAMTVINDKFSNGGSGFLKSAIGILALTATLTKVISAFNQLLKIDLPSDYGVKLAILTGMIVEVGLLAVALGAAAKLADGGSIKTGPLIAMCLGLVTIVGALKTVMKMELPSDAASKFTMLTFTFGVLGGLIIAVGYASSLAGGNLKAAGTLLSMCVLIASITASLVVLTIVPLDKMATGAIALSAVLATLALALAQAGKIAEPDTYKSVLAMAITVGAITAALGVLSMVPWQDLTVAGAALGAMLLALALDFLTVSKIAQSNTWQPITAMIGVMVTITGSLYFLSQQPWSNMLVAAGAMSAALLAFSSAFLIISKAQGMDLAKAATFLAFTLATIPIGVALYQLSQQPWQGMLAAAASISGVLLAFTAAFVIISKSNPNVGAVIGFVAAAVALSKISEALKMLSGESWNSIIPGATALVTTMGLMSASLIIASKGGVNLAGVLGFVAAAVALIPLANVIKQLSGLSWDEVAKGLVALAGGLAVLGVAGLAGTAIAPGLLALSAALLVFAGGIAAVGAALPIFVDGLTVAFQALSGFVSSLANVIPQMAEAGQNLMLGLVAGIASGVQTVIDTVANVANGIIDKVKSVLGIHSPSVIFEALGINVDEGFAKGLLGGEGGISSAVDTVFNGISDKVNLESMFGKGEEGTSLFGEGLLSGEGNIDSILSQVTDASDTDITSYLNLGNEASGLFGSGVEGNDASVKEKLNEMVSTAGIDLKDYSSLGFNASDTFGTSLQSKKPNVDDAVRKTTDASKTNLDSYTKLGQSASDKFAKGVKSGVNNVSSQTSSSIAKTLKQAIDSAIKSTDFTSAGKTIVKSMAEGIKSATEQASNAAKSVAEAAGTAIKNQNEQFKNKGIDSMKSFINGIKDKQKDAETTISNILKDMLKVIKSEDSKFKESGSKSINNYVDGVKEKSKSAVNAVNDLVSKIVKTLANKASEYKQPGITAAKNYISALENSMKSGMSKAINNMATYGKRIVEGVAKGINSNMSIATRAAAQLAEKIDQQVKTTLEIHSPSKKGALRGAQYLEGIEVGIKDNAKKPVQAVAELADAMDETFTGKVQDMSLKAGLVMAATANVVAENQSNSLHSEQNYWEKLLEIKQNGADREYYQGMSIVQFRKSMMEQSNAIVDQYNQKIEEATKNMMSNYSLLAEVDKSQTRTRQEQAKYEYEIAKKEEATSKSSKATVENVKSAGKILEEQTKVFESYAKNMQKLQKKLKNTNLWDEVKDLGVDSLGYLKELNKMSDKELQNYVELYDRKLMAAHQAASVQMNEVTKETKKQLEAMYAIDEEGNKRNKKNKKDNLDDERDYWEKLLEAKQSGIEAEKYAGMEIQEFRQNLLTETNNLLNEYKNQFEQTRDNIMSQVDLFSEIGEKTTVTKDQLIQNLKEQIDAYREFGETLDSVVSRLEGRNIVDYIKSLGVNSLGELKAINSMTDEELSFYADQYDVKLTEAGNIASTKMSDLQKETEEKLGNLFGTVKEIDLTEFINKFDGTLESIEGFVSQLDKPLIEAKSKMETGAQNIIDAIGNGLTDGVAKLAPTIGAVGISLITTLAAGMTDTEPVAANSGQGVINATLTPMRESEPQFHNTGKGNAGAYVEGINDQKEPSGNAGKSVANEAVTNMRETEPSFTESGTASGTNYVTAIAEQTEPAGEAGKTVATEAHEKISENVEDFFEAGSAAGARYADGLLSQLDNVISAASALANAASGSASGSLSVASPSKVMTRIGEYAGMGLANGVNNYVKKSEEAGKNVGSAVVEGAKEAINSNISKVVTDPVITAKVEVVADDKSMEAVKNKLKNMFNSAVKVTADNAKSTSSSGKSNTSKSSSDNNKKSSSNKNDTTYQIIQNNYSPKALSTIDIYRQTNNAFTLLKEKLG